MKANIWVLLAITFAGSACASAPIPESPLTESWPLSVDKTCPRRTIVLECFRKPSIETAMAGLIEQFRSCYRPGAKPVKAVLRVETRGGSPSCVGYSPRRSEAARCLATTVARHLSIPNSPPDEACSFTYPIVLK